MRIVERSPDQRQLQTLFLPQEPRRVMPDEVAEEIVLTHPAQPPTASFLERLFRAQIVGAAAQSTVDLPSAPADRYFWVQAMGAFHNEGVARLLTILLGSSTLGYTELTESFTANTNASKAVTRAFLVPPGLNVRVTVAAIAGAAVVTARFLYVELLLAENHPGL